MRRAARTVALALLLAGCGDGPATIVLDAPETPAGAADAASPPIDIPATTTVRLLEAGVAPHETLRFVTPAAERQSISLRQKTSMEVQVDSRPVPQPPDIGALVMTLQAQTTDASDPAALRYTITLVGADIDGGTIDATMRATIRERLRIGLGLQGEVVRDALGIGRTVSVSPPPGVDAAPPGVLAGVQLLVDAVGVPLPMEAVGVGARWEVVSPENNQGARARLTRTFELLSRDGPRIALAVTLAKQAAPGTMRPPGLPAGAEFEMRELSATGSGTIQLSLDALLPLAASIVTEDHAAFDLIDGQRRSRMRRHSKVTLTIE